MKLMFVGSWASTGRSAAAGQRSCPLCANGDPVEWLGHSSHETDSPVCISNEQLESAAALGAPALMPRNVKKLS